MHDVDGVNVEAVRSALHHLDAGWAFRTGVTSEAQRLVRHGRYNEALSYLQGVRDMLDSVLGYRDHADLVRLAVHEMKAAIPGR